MDNVNLLEALMQEDKSTNGETFESFVRDAARFAVLSAVVDEVTALCGPKHERRVPAENSIRSTRRHAGAARFGWRRLLFADEVGDFLGFESPQVS